MPSSLGRETSLSSLTKFVITFPMNTPTVQHVGELSTTRSSTPTMSFEESRLSDGPAYLSLLSGYLWLSVFLCGSSFSQIIAMALHHARAPSPLPKSSLCSLWFKLFPNHPSGFAPRRSISLT